MRKWNIQNDGLVLDRACPWEIVLGDKRKGRNHMPKLKWGWGRQPYWTVDTELGGFSQLTDHNRKVGRHRKLCTLKLFIIPRVGICVRFEFEVLILHVL